MRPGGAEAYAFELYQAMRASDEFEPIFLAKAGPPMSKTVQPHRDTPFAAVGDDPNQYFLYTDFAEFDRVFGVSRRRGVVAQHFGRLLRSLEPDIVHFQHTLFLGYDLITEARNVLPDAPILYTLHEYLPICQRNGQMVRVGNDELCYGATPQLCHGCFPDISTQTFFLRRRFIQSHLAHVDLFLAPSVTLRERYIDWGIPPDKIRFEDYGRLPMPPAPERPSNGLRNVFGFFGQLTPFKGVHVLLEAMEILNARGVDAQLRLHGANLEIQPKVFQQRFWDLLEAARANVTFVGRFDHTELPRLMSAVDWVIVPSIWWENSPLVIQEAFSYGRPVICSDIGAMAEKVEPDVAGLHFRVHDPTSLADTIAHAVESPGLWNQLRSGIPGVYPMDAHLRSLTRLYRSLLGARSAPTRERHKGARV
jgi:glycosyltransferase involved in cell wall biosynthesis